MLCQIVRRGESSIVRAGNKKMHMLSSGGMKGGSAQLGSVNMSSPYLFGHAGRAAPLPLFGGKGSHGSFCMCGFCTNARDPTTPATEGTTAAEHEADHDELVLENLKLQQEIERMKRHNEFIGVENVVAKNMELEREIERLQSQLKAIHPHSIRNSLLQEDPDIALLLANNKRWVKTEMEKDPNFFKRIGGPQKPRYLYIGCSDSRVPANQILGMGPGEVFVHRNVGNQVVGNDLNVLSGIEFAVEVLGVKHIIVAGHYDCGAIRAATKTQDLGLLENWVRTLRDIYRMHHTTLDVIEDEDERHRKFVEISVVEQCLNLYKTGVVQRKRKQTSKDGERSYPRIHAFVFDPKVGLMKNLPVDFKASVAKFRHIYDMY